MKTIFKKHRAKIGKIVALASASNILFSGLFLGILLPQNSQADTMPADANTCQTAENNLLSIVNTSMIALTGKRVEMVVTAYSSTPGQTDDTPFTTASNKMVKDGIVANNMLPFGTKIRMPELYGNKVFVVEDRMNKRKGNYHLDIWFPEYQQAKNFGVKTTYIEILED